jgi:hypothetical protein
MNHGALLKKIRAVQKKEIVTAIDMELVIPSLLCNLTVKFEIYSFMELRRRGSFSAGIIEHPLLQL